MCKAVKRFSGHLYNRVYYFISTVEIIILCYTIFTEGEQCEEVLASVECVCPTSHVCTSQSEPPGYKCQLVTLLCSNNQTCPPLVTSNMYIFTWDEIVGVCVAVIAITSFVGIFILYR